MNLRPITSQQLAKFHVLLNQFGIIEDKAELVKQFTNGRETSSKKLTFDEAKSILHYLSKFDPCDKMRKKVFSLAYQAKIIYGDTKEDKQMNNAKLNSFLLEKGTVKKELNKMSKAELVKVVSQFSMIVKHQGESGIAKNVKNMVAELGIVTTRKGAKNPLLNQF
jgi:hypothetical protein